MDLEYTDDVDLLAELLHILTFGSPRVGPWQSPSPLFLHFPTFYSIF